MHATRWSQALVLALAAAGVLAPAPARATVLVALDFERLAVEADRVVVGDVTGLRARWSADGAIIETVVDVAVAIEVTNASGGATVRIVQPGGRIGDRGLYVSGMPGFRVGERVLLFLRARDPEGDGTPCFSVLGMAQGKFLVLPRAGGGWDAVQQFDAGLAFAAPDGQGTMRVVDAPRPMTIDLDEAIARIRAARGEVSP
jgi:hypothetical protein